jgi:hypothetical protein
MNFVQLHRGPFDCRRPATVGCVHKNQEVPSFDLDGFRRANPGGGKKREDHCAKEIHTSNDKEKLDGEASLPANAMLLIASPFLWS